MNYLATDSTNLGHHSKAIGTALDVECPRCLADPKEKCINVTTNPDTIFPAGVVIGMPHVERGRLARWISMFHL